MNFQIKSLLIFFLIIYSKAKADSTGTVLFVDSSANQYLRSPSSNDAFQSDSMLLPEVGAAVSVLLGFAPPSTLSAAASTKLNEILMPNPFNRPRVVFALEIGGISDPKVIFNKENSMFGNVHMNKIDGTERADIRLPGEDEVSVISLDEPLENYSDKDISEFASWLGGEYVADSSEALNGKLSIPLRNGNRNFDMSKRIDREFVASLLSHVHNVRRAIDRHTDSSQCSQSPSELISGRFDGMKALQNQHGSGMIAQQGEQLFVATLSKIFSLLQEAYRGQIVGVIVCYETSPVESGKVLNVISTPRLSSRRLAETDGAKNTTVAHVVLVRRTLAWVTGIILIIATLIGIYFLLNMPITKDTLLYSNVKLD